MTRIQSLALFLVLVGGGGLSIGYLVAPAEWSAGLADLPPLKWSSLKYVLTMEDEINGEEAAYS
jgi:hypothetical protein